jgi:hypothetical protein
MSVSATTQILRLDVWMNPVIKYANPERRQVQSNTLSAAGITRKQNLESGGVTTLKFLLGPQNLLQCPKPASHVNGNFPHGWFIHIGIAAILKR